MGKFNLLFPVEIINRELDFRVFLSVLLARPDTRIFVGQHDVIHTMVPFMKNGVYIGKSVFPNDSTTETGARYGKLKESGFRVVYLDEEGAVFRGGEEAWEWALGSQMNVKRLEAEDYVCAWGKFQQAFYRKQSPRCTDNVRVTGHPRFDIYRPKYREYFAASVDQIKAKYGPYVLINTNLALANSSAGADFSFSAINGWDPTSPQKARRHIAEYSYLWTLLHSFASLLVSLSTKFPHVQFVLRPHPSEGLEHWRAILKDFKNVHVLHEGPVAPWILGSEAVIQNGCTTGIEAYLAGTDVIVYRSLESAEFDPYLPNSVGLTCRDEQSVIDALGVTLSKNGKLAQTPAPEQVLALFANLDGEDAFARLESVYDEARRSLPAGGEFRDRDFATSDLFRRAKQRGKNMARSYVPRRLVGTSARWARAFSQMFYGFREDDLERRFALAQRILNKKVRVQLHSSELFSVDAA